MAEPVHLDDRAAFQAALHDYHMSEHAQQVLKESRLVVLSGLAGGGRNTVINYLVEHHNYFFMVSDTTRPPKLRNGVMEQDGVQYHFRKEADMLRDIQKGEFVEAEIIHNQQVSGTSIRELDRANKSGRIILHETEFGGASFIASAKPDAVMIGLLPPSYDEWIRRFTNREKVSEQELTNRLHTAGLVLENLLSQSYFRLVLNDTVEQCAEDIRNIVEDGVIVEAKQQRCRQVASDMLARIRGTH